MYNGVLTDSERWECVARHINTFFRLLYTAGDTPPDIALSNVIQNEKMTIEEALHSEQIYLPCCVCPYYEDKCNKNWEPIQINCQVIEQFTGPGSIMGYSIPWLDKVTSHHEEHKDS